MTTLAASRSRRTQSIAVLITLAALSLAATVLTRDVVNDDPFITYRYARNLASGAGFVYNPGEPILSTTAPLYALLLAGLAMLGIEPPIASLIIGSLATFGSGALLYRLGMSAQHMALAAISAILLVTSPLIWMAMGMESSLYLLLAIGALNVAADSRWSVAGLLAAGATLVRGDGLLIVGLIVLIEARERRHAPWHSILSAAALLLPAATWTTIVYGNPFPTTLRAKILQANLGITGFFPGARFPDGLVRLVAAYVEQSPLYVATSPLIIAGLTQIRAQRWAWPIVAWSGLHLIAYTALGVAPYRWYYIPLLPAVYVLIGLGIVALSTLALPRFRTIVMLGATLIVLVTQARSIWEIHRSTDPDVPRADLIGFDALPETSGPLYRRVGRWLHDHTPPTASVGVMEVGVTGYYAERRMIDFLGLLQPDVADALGRRDIYWSIPHSLPDYLVLTSVNPLYNYDLLADAWFRATYVPTVRFDDPRFWGSPITIYQRRIPDNELSFEPVEREVGAMRLTGFAVESIAVHPGTPFRIRLDWAKPATPAAQVSVSLIGPRGQVIATASRAYDTTTWPASGGSVYHTMVTGSEAPPGPYRALVDIQSEYGSGQITIGAWKSPLGTVALPPDLIPRAARFSDAIDLLGYTLDPTSTRAGDEVQLVLYWRSHAAVDRDYTVFVHLENEDGQLSLAADSQPRQGDYPTSIWSPGEIIDDPRAFRLPDDLAAGAYHIKMGLYLLDGGQRLTVNGLDQIDLTTLTIREP